MKTGSRILPTVGLLAAILAVVALAADTKPAANCEQRLEALAEANIEAVNTPDGMVITITAASPEAAALIQEFWQNCGMRHLLGHDGACKEGESGHGGGSGCGDRDSSVPGEAEQGCGDAGKGCGGNH